MMKDQNPMQVWIRRALLAVLAAAAAFLWWTEGRYETLENDLAQPTPTPALSRDQRSRRESAYESDSAALRALAENDTTDEATREMAARKLAQLITEHQNELGLEETLREAGYENAIVLVQNGAVTVMIPEEKLNEANSAQILELCVAHAEVGAENVRVMGYR